MRVALRTLGCKLNQAEAERLTRDLTDAGLTVVGPEIDADVYVLNTCTVTRIADAKCRAWLRQVHRSNPEAQVIVTGCYAQRAPDELKHIDGVSIVAGNDEKMALLSRLKAIDRHSGASPALPAARRTRSFIKVQDGCVRACAYCIVPLVRGCEKSVPADAIIDEVKSRVAEGYREVVLTGTEVGVYQGEAGLQGLLERILTETGISRLRLSSLQPQEVSPGLLKVWQDERMCAHFHLCLQSGSVRVLRRMRRAYSPGDFRQAVRTIRGLVTDVSITTDVIVGFPGETDHEFGESLDFCREIGFARIHVFPYSARPGTEAGSMTGQIDSQTKKERSQKMAALARESADAFRRGFIGRKMPILWEVSKADGTWSGLTGNYIKVFTKSNKDLANQLIPARIIRLKGDGIWAAGES